MRLSLLSVLVALMTFAVAAGDTKVTLDGKNTKIKFVGSKKEGKHDGGFGTVSGSATFDKDPTSVKLEVEIDVSSLYSDDKKLTAHLLSPDFFNARKFPKAKFATTKVEKDGDKYKVTGDLTLLGKTKSVTFPAKIEAKDRKLSLTSDTFTIKRSEWGMTFGKGKVYDEVQLNVVVDAQ
jgi:polyisoprenoid-binding protein YceI